MNNGAEDYKSTNVDVVCGINYFISKQLVLGANLAALSHYINSPKKGPEVETTTLGFDTNNISFNEGHKF